MLKITSSREKKAFLFNKSNLSPQRQQQQQQQQEEKEKEKEEEEEEETDRRRRGCWSIC